MTLEDLLSSSLQEFNLNSTVKNVTLIYFSYSLTNSQLISPFAGAFIQRGIAISWDALRRPSSKTSPQNMFDEIRRCSLLIAFIGDSYFHEKYTSNEFSFALDKNIPVLPVILTNTENFERHLQRCLPSFNRFLEDVTIIESQDDTRIQELVEITIDNYGVTPEQNLDWRQMYLTGLIGHIQSSKSLLNWIWLSNSYNANFRPQPHFIQRWQAPGRFYVESDRIYKDIRDVIQFHSRIWLQGPLGSGKTSTIHSLLLETAVLYITHNDKITFPLYLEIGSEILNHSIEVSIATSLRIAVEVIHELLGKPIFIFIDDPHNLLFETDYRLTLSRWLTTLPITAQFIIASEAIPFDIEMAYVKINGLIDTQIVNFLNNYLPKNLSEALIEEFSSINLELQEKNTQLYALACSPFYLTLLASIQAHSSNSSEALPYQSGQIIAEAINIVYDQLKLSQADKEQLQSSLILIARHILESHPQNYIPLNSFPSSNVFYRHGRAIQSLGLLEVRDGKILFPHPYILYFFASFCVSDEEIINTLSDVNLSPSVKFIWERIAQFKAELGLLNIEHLTIIATIDPLFALRLYKETREDDERIHNQLVRQIIYYCTANVGSRQNAIELLQHVHPEISRDIMLNVARSDDWEHRITAINMVKDLVTTLTSGLRDALIELPQDSDINLPYILKRLGNANLIPELIRLLDDPSWQVRRSATSVLGTLGDSASVPALVEKLDDENDEVIIEALQAIDHLKDSQVIPWLVPLFNNQNHVIQDKASHLLSQFGEPAIDSLIASIDEGSTVIKILGINTLAQIQHERALDTILNASYDKDISVRCIALQALGNQEHIVAINRLIESLADHSTMRGAKKRVSDIAAEILRGLGYLSEQPTSDEFIEVNDMTQIKADFPQTHTRHQKKTASSGKERLKRITQESPLQTIEETTLPNDYLNDPEWRVRAEFVRNIQIDSENNQDIIPLLKRALQDEDNHVRIVAIEKLAELKIDQAVGGLLYAMQDRDYAVSDVAAKTLQKMGRRAVPGLMKLLSSKNVNIRGMAIETLGEIGDPIVAPALVKLLADKENPWLSSKRICDIAAQALTKINTSEARRAVTEWRKQELQEHAQQHHIEVVKPKQSNHVIPTTDHKQIVTELINELRNNEWEQQVNAAKALSEYARAMHGTSHQELLNTLVATLNDDNWVVRWATVEALAWIGDSAIIPQLEPLSKDENWIVKVAVVRALQEIGDAQATYIIRNLAKNENDVVREVSAEALGIFTDSPEIEILTQLTTDKNEFVRQAAVQSLGMLNNPATMDALKQALDDSNGNVRWTAMRILSQWHNEYLVPIFISKLEDKFVPHLEEYRICDFALQALSTIDTLEARLAVEKWQPILGKS